MNANEKRAFNAAMRAARSVNSAGEKLASSTEDFVKAAGGHDAAIKLLNEQRAKGRTWRQEREEGTPLYRVYNAVSVAKSRANPKKRKARQTAGKAGEQAKQAEQAEQAKQAEQAEQAKQAGTPASDADVLGHILQWGAARIAKAIQEQTAVLNASAVDVLTETLGLLINQPQAPKAPAKRAPAKRAPAKRTTRTK